MTQWTQCEKCANPADQVVPWNGGHVKGMTPGMLVCKPCYETGLLGEPLITKRHIDNLREVENRPRPRYIGCVICGNRRHSLGHETHECPENPRRTE